MNKKLLCCLSFSLVFSCSSLMAGGGNRSVADFDEAAAYYTTDKGAEDIGRAVRLDVGYASSATKTTAFGEANVEVHTFVQNVPAGSAMIIAGEEAAALLEKYGTEAPDKGRVRTRSLRVTFLGLEGKKPVFKLE